MKSTSAIILPVERVRVDREWRKGVGAKLVMSWNRWRIAKKADPQGPIFAFPWAMGNLAKGESRAPSGREIRGRVGRDFSMRTKPLLRRCFDRSDTAVSVRRYGFASADNF
jgi:hypothetical protein